MPVYVYIYLHVWWKEQKAVIMGVKEMNLGKKILNAITEDKLQKQGMNG